MEFENKNRAGNETADLKGVVIFEAIWVWMTFEQAAVNCTYAREQLAHVLILWSKAGERKLLLKPSQYVKSVFPQAPWKSLTAQAI